MSTQDEDTQDMRRLYAALAMVGDMASWKRPMSAGVKREDLCLFARFYWRMADAMLATEEERS